MALHGNKEGNARDLHSKTENEALDALEEFESRSRAIKERLYNPIFRMVMENYFMTTDIGDDKIWSGTDAGTVNISAGSVRSDGESRLVRIRDSSTLAGTEALRARMMEILFSSEDYVGTIIRGYQDGDSAMTAAAVVRSQLQQDHNYQSMSTQLLDNIVFGVQIGAVEVVPDTGDDDVFAPFVPERFTTRIRHVDIMRYFPDFAQPEGPQAYRMVMEETDILADELERRAGYGEFDMARVKKAIKMGKKIGKDDTGPSRIRAPRRDEKQYPVKMGSLVMKDFYGYLHKKAIPSREPQDHVRVITTVNGVIIRSEPWIWNDIPYVEAKWWPVGNRWVGMSPMIALLYIQDKLDTIGSLQMEAAIDAVRQTWIISPQLSDVTSVETGRRRGKKVFFADVLPGQSIQNAILPMPFDHSVLASSAQLMAEFRSDSEQTTGAVEALLGTAPRPRVSATGTQAAAQGANTRLFGPARHIEKDYLARAGKLIFKRMRTFNIADPDRLSEDVGDTGGLFEAIPLDQISIRSFKFRGSTMFQNKVELLNSLIAARQLIASDPFAVFETDIGKLDAFILETMVPQHAKLFRVPLTDEQREQLRALRLKMVMQGTQQGSAPRTQVPQ